MESEFVWDDLRFFLAVARTRSLSDAARRLGVSASTVSRRIDALESALDRRLFRRHRDGYALTAEGERLVADADAAEARILSLQRNALDGIDAAAGVVRLATPELIAHELIVPELAAFYAAHPAVSLELLCDVRPISLAREEADVVVRVVRPTQGAYTVRRIGRFAVGLFASPAYVSRQGTSTSVGGFAGHRVIAWERDLAFLQVARWLDATAGEAEVVLRTSLYTTQVAACCAGCGLAALPVPIGRRHGLTQMPTPPFELDLWLIVRSDLRAVKRIVVVCDFLIELFRRIDDGRASPPG